RRLSDEILGTRQTSTIRKLEALASSLPESVGAVYVVRRSKFIWTCHRRAAIFIEYVTQYPFRKILFFWDTTPYSEDAGFRNESIVFFMMSMWISILVSTSFRIHRYLGIFTTLTLILFAIFFVSNLLSRAIGERLSFVLLLQVPIEFSRLVRSMLS